MKVIYYAHCMTDYYTDRESKDINTLERLGFKVINPSNKIYTDGWKRKGMSYANFLLERCTCFAFKRLPDGRISAGVGYEIKAAQQLGIPIIELPYIREKKFMTRQETRDYIFKQKQVDLWAK